MNKRNCICPSCMGAKRVEADAVRLTPLSRRITRWVACPTCGGNGRWNRPDRKKGRK